MPCNEALDADFNSWQEGKGIPNNTTPTYAIITSRSYHWSAVNVALVDGSVQSIDNDIELAVWRAMATRAGNETVVE